MINEHELADVKTAISLLREKMDERELDRLAKEEVRREVAEQSLSKQRQSFFFIVGVLRGVLTNDSLRKSLFKEYGGIIPHLDKNLKALHELVYEHMFRIEQENSEEKKND